MTAVPVGAVTCCTECSGELSFTEEPESEIYPLTMHRPAWCLTDLSSLWEIPNQRGANVLIPLLAGRYPEPRRDDETDYALPFIVSGVVDESGDPAEDENQQLMDNLAYLRENVFTFTGATRPAELVSPDGNDTLTAEVQFGERPLVRRYKRSGLWVGTLHMIVPAGAFA